MTPDTRTAAELAQLRSELHATNKSMERIASAVEKTLGDHESRLRSIEAEQLRAIGVIRLIAWLGAPAAAGLVLYIAKHA